EGGRLHDLFGSVRPGPDGDRVPGRVDGNLGRQRDAAREVLRVLPVTAERADSRLDDVVPAVAVAPDGDGVAGRVERDLWVDRGLAGHRKALGRTPGPGCRPPGGLDDVRGAVRAFPDRDRIPGGIERDLRHHGVLARRGQV